MTVSYTQREKYQKHYMLEVLVSDIILHVYVYDIILHSPEEVARDLRDLTFIIGGGDRVEILKKSIFS